MTDEAKPPMGTYTIKQQEIENIHNDLGNAALYFKDRVETREAVGDTDGIKFELMAGLTMCAFFIEASITYVAEHRLADWDEWESFDVKVGKAAAAVGLSPDFSRRPWSVTGRLQRFRNTLAHGKPKQLSAERTFTAPMGKRLKHQRLASSWVKELEVGSLSQCYEDANKVSLELFSAAGIDPLEAASGGSAEISFDGPELRGTGMPSGWVGSPESEWKGNDPDR